jgi:hypothetical protein
MYWWGTFAYHVDVPLAKSLAGRGRPALHWSIVPFSFTDGSAAAKNVVGLSLRSVTTFMAIYRTHKHLSASIAS